VKSGVGRHLYFAMNDKTFQSHMRLSRHQFDALNNKFGEMGKFIK